MKKITTLISTHYLLGLELEVNDEKFIVRIGLVFFNIAFTFSR